MITCIQFRQHLDQEIARITDYCLLIFSHEPSILGVAYAPVVDTMLSVGTFPWQDSPSENQ